MRIGIDARFLTHPQPGGFKTYVSSLVHALAEVDPANTYVLYVDRPPEDGARLPTAPNFQLTIVPGNLPGVGMPAREQVRLAWQARQDRLDVFHAPCLTAPLWLNCPLVLTIHDMIWKFPRQFSGARPAALGRALMEDYYRWVPEWAVRRAAQVITVSHAARQSIQQHLAVPADRLTVTHEAADPRYQRVEDPAALARVRAQYGLTRDFILAIGSADPRKNLGALLQAYARLPADLRAHYHLAIVWTHHFLASHVADQIKALGIDGQVAFLSKVPSEDLVGLYSLATAFAFPSRYEGFGLPLLEAMACGAPVVAADNSSIPEIVGEAALLTPTDGVAEMAEALTRLLQDPALRAEYRRRGQARAAQFSWARCARETMAAYAAARRTS